MSVQPHGETERVAAAWQALTAWLTENAPVSHASLLPPGTEEEIATADSRLHRRLGYGLPAEPAALWRLCGGVRHQFIEADEEGEVDPARSCPAE